MSIEGLNNKEWLFIFALITIFMFNWIEYDSRLRIQERIEKDIEITNYKLNNSEKIINNIMPSAFKQEPKWTRNKKKSY